MYEDSTTTETIAYEVRQDLEEREISGPRRSLDRLRALLDRVQHVQAATEEEPAAPDPRDEAITELARAARCLLQVVREAGTRPAILDEATTNKIDHYAARAGS